MSILYIEVKYIRYDCNKFFHRNLIDILNAFSLLNHKLLFAEFIHEASFKFFSIFTYNNKYYI